MSLADFVLSAAGKLKDDYIRLNSHFASIKSNLLAGYQALQAQIDALTPGAVPAYYKTNVLNYAAPGATIYDGVTSAVSAINAALADMPTGGTLYFPMLGNGEYLIDSNLSLTVYPNITIEFESGAKLSIADGKTLTGSNTKIEAGLWQIFDLNTSGLLNGTWLIHEIPFEYFEDFDEAQDFLNSIGGGRILFQSKTYILNINIKYSNISIKGSKSTVFTPSSSLIPVIYLSENSEFNELSDFEIDCTDRSCDGIYIGNSTKEPSRLTFNNIYIYRANRGIYFHNIISAEFNKVYTYFCNYGLLLETGQIATQIKFNNCMFRNSEQNGVKAYSGKGFIFDYCVFENNKKEAFWSIGDVGDYGAQDMTFNTCWFENNSVVSSSYDTSHIVLDGISGPTKNFIFNNCIFGSKGVGNYKVYSYYSENCELNQCDFYSDEVIDELIGCRKSNTFNFRVNNRKNSSIVDRKLLSFDTSGGGIIIESTEKQICFNSGNTSIYSKFSNINKLNVINYIDSIPNAGSWEQGDRIINGDPVATDYIGYICTQQGTFGTLVGVTASTYNSTRNITVNSSSNLSVGDYITITNVTGIYVIIQIIDSTTVKLHTFPNQIVSNEAISFYNPVFKGYGLIQA